MARERVTTLLRIDDPRTSEPPAAPPAAGRFAMVWPLTLDAWAFKGEPIGTWSSEPTPWQCTAAWRP